ncbi:hypothetical protein HaLaN_30179 [Haematococcus lacustris]|uniref:Uncharacterized protein n=1 Tax=Haematococcus lacustris TaxID=44745 RepID=A0A6A0AFY2_HAELA|nr:hypothetical protein HaLaN_30179 [Haematococcus lacustris]
MSNLAAGATADWAAFVSARSSSSTCAASSRSTAVHLPCCDSTSSKKSEMRMPRRYVERSLKKLYLEYEWQCLAHLKKERKTTPSPSGVH